MLLDEEPAHVGKEKAPTGVVRVRVRFAKLVVDAVIAGPVVNGSLVGNRVANDEEKTYEEVRFVGAVTPEAVDTDGNAKAAVGSNKGIVQCTVKGETRNKRGVRYSSVSRTVHKAERGDVLYLVSCVFTVKHNVPDRP
jgi:hypothetical protein